MPCNVTTCLLTVLRHAPVCRKDFNFLLTFILIMKRNKELVFCRVYSYTACRAFDTLSKRPLSDSLWPLSHASVQRNHLIRCQTVRFARYALMLQQNLQFPTPSVLKMSDPLFRKGLNRNMCLMQAHVLRYGLYLATSATEVSNEPLISPGYLKVFMTIDQR